MFEVMLEVVGPAPVPMTQNQLLKTAIQISRNSISEVTLSIADADTGDGGSQLAIEFAHPVDDRPVSLRINITELVQSVACGYVRNQGLFEEDAE